MDTCQGNYQLVAGGKRWRGNNKLMCNPIFMSWGLAGFQARQSHNLMHIGVICLQDVPVQPANSEQKPGRDWAGIARVWLIISLVAQNMRSNWLSEKENKLRHGSVENNGFVVFFGIRMSAFCRISVAEWEMGYNYKEALFLFQTCL